MKYNDYLKTKHWANKKKEYREKKGRMCRICGSEEKIHLHHRQYKENEKSILFKEKNHQLYSLCPSCHSSWHASHGLKKTKLKYLLRAARLIKAGVLKSYAIKFCTNGTLCRNILNYSKNGSQTACRPLFSIGSLAN